MLNAPDVIVWFKLFRSPYRNNAISSSIFTNMERNPTANTINYRIVDKEIRNWLNLHSNRRKPHNSHVSLALVIAEREASDLWSVPTLYTHTHRIEGTSAAWIGLTWSGLPQRYDNQKNAVCSVNHIRSLADKLYTYTECTWESDVCEYDVGLALGT